MSGNICPAGAGEPGYPFLCLSNVDSEELGDASVIRT
jgi:hypothetical protein